LENREKKKSEIAPNASFLSGSAAIGAYIPIVGFSQELSSSEFK
jgi:hypothetical protein